MKYILLKDMLSMLEEFEMENFSRNTYTNNIEGFKKWIIANDNSKRTNEEPDWEGKANGRSAESAISTLIVHMNRFGKSYSKSVLFGSNFFSQDDFIYLITLKALGEMTKIDLIKKNVHEKSTGMQIINRLITQGWISQLHSETDKRSKILKISNEGLQVLENQMNKIRKATTMVTGNLLHREKMELIRILNKLNEFHLKIYNKNIEPKDLLN